jgi:hypothetical protein
VTVEGEEKLQQWKNLIEKENFQKGHPSYIEKSQSNLLLLRKSF